MTVGRKMPKPFYSGTRAGYEAWLEDGNVGTLEDFREEVRVGSRQYLKDKIVLLLNGMSVEDLAEILELIRDRF